jgi:hypothetical protein
VVNKVTTEPYNVNACCCYHLIKIYAAMSYNVIFKLRKTHLTWMTMLSNSLSRKEPNQVRAEFIENISESEVCRSCNLRSFHFCIYYLFEIFRSYLLLLYLKL